MRAGCATTNATSTTTRSWPERQYPAENLSNSGYIPPEALPQVTEKLLERGYKDWNVRAILGENFLRIASRVWQRA